MPSLQAKDGDRQERNLCSLLHPKEAYLDNLESQMADIDQASNLVQKVLGELHPDQTFLHGGLSVVYGELVIAYNQLRKGYGPVDPSEDE